MTTTQMLVLVATAGLAAAEGLILSIGLCVTFGWKDGSRWVQNWASASTYLLSSFPIACGIFSYTLLGSPAVLPTGPTRLLVLGLAALVGLLVVVNAWQDFVREDPLP